MENSDPCAKQHGHPTEASWNGPHQPLLLAAMIDRHARPIKPGFWQLSAGGVSVNLDDGQMARYKASGRFWYDEAEGRLVFDTGYPRLDHVLGKIYEEQGFLGPDDAERTAPSPCTIWCVRYRGYAAPASTVS